jgi:hypothetical protein
MRFDTKIAIAVREDLAAWQKLNVTAFLASGIAADAPEIIGKPYEDGDGNVYLALFGQPVVVYAASAGQLSAVHQKGLGRGLTLAVYTEEMFGTGNDEDNRAVVRAVAADGLKFAGLAACGPRNTVDKVFKGVALHP